MISAESASFVIAISMLPMYITSLSSASLLKICRIKLDAFAVQYYYNGNTHSKAIVYVVLHLESLAIVG